MKRPILVAIIGYIIGIIVGLYLQISVVPFYIVIIAIYEIYKKFFIHKKLKQKLNLFSIKRYFRYIKIFINSKIIIVLIIVSTISNGTGSESDFHVSPEHRAIIFPVSRKEQNNDLRDLLISQQVRRIDELERQVDMLEALLHGRRRKEQAANTLPEEQTDTAADKSPDTDGQQQ